MTLDQLLATLGALAAIGFIVWFFWLRRSPGVRAAVVGDGYQEQMVLVKGGYTPDTIRVAAGSPVRLLFRREETSARSEQVLLPDFGEAAMLPTGQMVPVEFLPGEPGSYEFTCQMSIAAWADPGGGRVMTTLTIIDSREAPAAPCLVCGNHIPTGEGVTARYGERILQFKCPGCAARFAADPERYLAREAAGCCGHESEASPASEWRWY